MSIRAPGRRAPSFVKEKTKGRVGSEEAAEHRPAAAMSALVAHLAVDIGLEGPERGRRGKDAPT
jgi:hypothetical protein